jgi:choline monooxygenase
MADGTNGAPLAPMAEARRGLELPTGDARPLPASLYVDPAVARAENARLFARSWMCAGYAHELPRPGDVLPAVIAGAPVVFVHGRDGAIRCFHNVCPHRGNLVATRPMSGAGNLVCRYHGWSFDLEGALRITPHWGGYGQPTVEGFDRACHGLKPVRLARWHDWLFINLSDDAAPFEAYFASFAAHCAGYDLSLVRYAETAPFAIKANWKLVEENFLEVLHLPSVHKGLNAVAPFNDHELVVEGPCLGTIIKVGLPARWAEPALPRFPGLAPGNRTAKNLALFPNFKLILGPDHCASMVEFADGHDRTDQRWDFYFVGAGAMEPKYDAARRAVIDFFCEVNGEDLGILESMQRARVSPAADGGVFSAAWEPAVQGFQKLVAEALA